MLSIVRNGIGEFLDEPRVSLRSGLQVQPEIEASVVQASIAEKWFDITIEE